VVDKFTSLIGGDMIKAMFFAGGMQFALSLITALSFSMVQQFPDIYHVIQRTFGRCSDDLCRTRSLFEARLLLL
jgi:hypothetical protein